MRMTRGPTDRATKQWQTLRRVAQPWTIILVITGLFQVFRGAPVDGAFFLVIAALLIADAVNLVRVAPVRIPPRLALYSVAAVLGVLMVVAPRHGIAEGIIVGGIGVTALIFAWPSPQIDRAATTSAKSDSTPATARPLRRAAIVWSIIGVMLALWEVSSFILGLASPHAEFVHPSISDLLDPALNTTLGRAVFTAVWIVGGIGLLRRGPDRREQRRRGQNSRSGALP